MSVEEQARIEAEEKETRGKTLLEVHQERMKTGAAAAKPKIPGKKASMGWNRYIYIYIIRILHYLWIYNMKRLVCRWGPIIMIFFICGLIFSLNRMCIRLFLF